MNIYNNFLYKTAKKVWYKTSLLLHGNNGLPYQVNDFKFKMPPALYKYVPSRFFAADYEKENFKFFKSVAKPGMICIDIGAHIGLYAAYMSKEGNATVYSFEPTPTSQEVFNDMMRVNGCSEKVILVPGAVSNISGKATFYMTDTPLWVGNSLSTNNFANDKVKGYEVNVYSIDDFARSNNLKIDFIKIDAEGVELDVLKGAELTFRKDRPAGILGMHPSTFTDKKDCYEKIWSILESYQLNIFYDNVALEREKFMTELFELKNPFDLQFTSK